MKDHHHHHPRPFSSVPRASQNPKVSPERPQNLPERPGTTPSVPERPRVSPELPRASQSVPRASQKNNQKNQECRRGNNEKLYCRANARTREKISIIKCDQTKKHIIAGREWPNISANPIAGSPDRTIWADFWTMLRPSNNM